jgi:hypothetical protein
MSSYLVVAMLMVSFHTPFLMALWLANLADARQMEGLPGTTTAALGYAILLGLFGVTIAGGLALWTMLTMVPSAIAPEVRGLIEAFAASRSLALAMTLLPILGALCLAPPTRELLARVIPIEPASSVHAVALSMATLLPLGLAGLGLGQIATLGLEFPEGYSAPPELVVYAVLVQHALWIVLGLIGVGLLARRDWGDTFVRLGIIRPTLGQVAAGCGVALALAMGNSLFQVLATLLGMPLTTASADPLVLVLSQSLVSLVAVNLWAGVAEEMLFRGALVPRFGLVLSTVLFGLLHLQYGLGPGLVMVLATGFILGILRERANTTTTIIAHAGYNLILVAFVILGRMMQ